MSNMVENVQGSIVPRCDYNDVWGAMREEENAMASPRAFPRDPAEIAKRKLIRKHRAWLELIDHECPSPYTPYRIGVYIRYFNQTKYDNYLDYHKQQFTDTIALCPRWTLVDFYVDEGQSAPNMENAKGLTRLFEDCFSGKVNLIVTQKVSNMSRKPEDLAFMARILAAQKNPIGMYFISEDLFTLASYYRPHLKDRRFLPSPDWKLLPDAECDEGWGVLNENTFS